MVWVTCGSKHSWWWCDLHVPLEVCIITMLVSVICDHFSTQRHLVAVSSIELSIPHMTLDVFGKVAIFCNSERKIMENWAFSRNRITGSALDTVKKKKKEINLLERSSIKWEQCLHCWGLTLTFPVSQLIYHSLYYHWGGKKVQGIKKSSMSTFIRESSYPA